MLAKALHDYVKVVKAVEVQGEFWLQTYGGRDYEEYSKMPTVVEYEGRLYGKMSFNSDQGYVAYKVGAPVAKIVKKGRK